MAVGRNGASPRLLSQTSSLESSHEFSVSRVPSNGTGGVVSSVVWLVIAVGLCFPWLLEQPSPTKAGDTPKSVAWFLVLALDLLIGTMSIFSLWFRRSTLSIILLLWGTGGIVATFLLGSFAMLPAIATICCCAEEFCLLGAADTSPLDDSFCLNPLDFCMETRWTLWCFFGGILLAMVSIVLLVNSVALHHKTLLDCEFQRNEAAKAVRAANRARRRRQELWEQEVYGGGYEGYNNFGVRKSLGRNDDLDDHASGTPHQTDRPDSRGSAAAPPFESPARSHSGRPSRATPAAAGEFDFGRASPPAAAAFAPVDDPGGNNTDIEMSRLGSPTSAPLSQSGVDEPGGEFTIGAYTGGPRGRDGGGGGGGGQDDDATRIASWGRHAPSNTGALMSWVAHGEEGDGRITPKTALRFKTSALSRAMNR